MLISVHFTLKFVSLVGVSGASAGSIAEPGVALTPPAL